jgi:hypothetical protein
VTRPTPPTLPIIASERDLAAHAPWQPRWRPGDLVSARFVPMGLLLELVTNSPRILAAAGLCFGGYGPAPEGRPVDLHLRLFEEAAEAAPGAAREAIGATAAISATGVTGAAKAIGATDARGAAEPASTGASNAPNPAEPVPRGCGPYLYQASGGGSVLVVDRAAGMAFGHLAPATVADLPLLQSRYLEAAVCYVLECRGFIGVHAAAVARGGRGLLLRGRSGQGKTTLAYAAVRRGFQAVAEDVVWIDSANARWWGTPWIFHLLPDARRLFPELAGRPLERQLNDEMKVAVDLEAVRRGSTTASAAAGPVVLLERRPGAASALAAVAPDAARREWFDGCAAREREVHGYEDALTGWLRQDAWRLSLGDDLEAALDLLETLLP